MTWYKMSQQVQDNATYTVVEGDSLSLIAQKMLKDINRWPEIQKLNNMQDPNKIKPGQVLKLPSVVEKKEEQIDSKKPSISENDGLNLLKAEIASGEGNYYAYNRGMAGDTKKPAIDITKLTIAQIMAKQNTKMSDGKRELFALGKYQMIPSTLAEAVKNPKVGVSVNDFFIPDVQEKLFMHLMYKRKNLMDYIEGRSDNIEAAVNDLAAEFASLPTTSGIGRYDNDKAGNKAKGGLERVEKIKNILKSIRLNK